MTAKCTGLVIAAWLEAGTYRTIVHRHDYMYVAADESERRIIQATSLDELAAYLSQWPTNTAPMPDAQWIRINRGEYPSPYPPMPGTKLVTQDTGLKCRCGGRLLANQVAIWCERVVFKDGNPAEDSPCDFAVMSG